jgi:hypothetical protein
MPVSPVRSQYVAVGLLIRPGRRAEPNWPGVGGHTTVTRREVSDLGRRLGKSLEHMSE